MKDIKYFALTDAIFERYENIPSRDVPLRENMDVLFERCHLSCLSLKSASYFLFEQYRNLFENCEDKKSFEMLSKRKPSK